MKVVYIHQYFRSPTMSGGTRSYEFARRLVDRGHEVHLITSDTDAAAHSAAWRTTVEAGVNVHWAAVPYGNSMSYRDRIRAFGRFAQLAGHRAAGLEQDVVFASSTPLTVAIPAAYCARRRRVPMVLEVRDLWPEVPIAMGALRSPVSRRAAWLLEAWAYRRSQHIVALSPDMADSIRSRFRRAAVSVIPNGCDIDLFAGADAAGRGFRESMPWLGSRPLILYAGTIGAVNGIDYVVRMAETLLRIAPDVRIAVVGKGREEAPARALAARLNVLDRNLFFLPPVPKTQVVGIFGACDLALSTVIDVAALGANSANKVFDAFAAGRPVGLNHGGWLATVVRDAGAGLLLPSDDPAGAAILARDFLLDLARRSEVRLAARRLAIEVYSRDLLFDQLEHVLLSAVGAWRRHHA